MVSTQQYTKPDRDHSEQSMPDRTVSGRPGAWRSSKAVGICAAAAVGLFALASSGCGSTTTTRNAADVGAVEVAVTAPSSGSVIAADQVMVRGTVTPANATVQVQGEPAAVGNGVFTGTATLHGGKTTVDVIGSAPGASPGSTSVVIDRQSTARGGGTGGTTRQVSPAPTPAIPNEGDPSSETSCGGGLAVGPDTTCAFAENVRSAYDGSGPGTVMAYSPVAHRTYAMTCSDGSYVACTGGNDASVYFPGESYDGEYEPHASPETDTTPSTANETLATLDEYWADIDAHNFTGAYAYLAPGASSLTEPEFISSEERAHIQHVEFHGHLGESSAGRATVEVDSLVTHDEQFGCRVWSGSYEMIEESGAWRIEKAALTPRSCG